MDHVCPTYHENNHDYDDDNDDNHDDIVLAEVKILTTILNVQ